MIIALQLKKILRISALIGLVSLAPASAQASLIIAGDYTVPARTSASLEAPPLPEISRPSISPLSFRFRQINTVSATVNTNQTAPTPASYAFDRLVAFLSSTFGESAVAPNAQAASVNLPGFAAVRQDTYPDLKQKMLFKSE